MILNYDNISFQVSIFNTLTEDNNLGHIQKAFSSPHFICLATRLKGITKFIYLGRGSGYEGVFIEDHNLPSGLRVRDRFLEFIRKNIVGRRIESISLDENDRIITLNLFRSRIYECLTLFWKGRELYFLHAEPLESGPGYKIFCSWKNSYVTMKGEISRKALQSQIIELLNEEGRFSSAQVIEEPEYKSLEDYIEQGEKLGTKELSKKKKFLKRKLSKIQQDYQRVCKWKELQEFLNTATEKDLEGYQINLFGIRFKFESGLNFYQRRDLVFNKLKSLRKAENFLRQRFEDTQLEFDGVVDGSISIEESTTEKVIQPYWPSKTKSSSQEVQVQGVKFFEFDGIKGVIGSNTTANDWIRGKWAKKDDIWFHLEGFKSAHAILKIKDMSDVSVEIASKIGSMIRDQSSLDATDIPLIYTHVKNVKGIKGQAGAVIYKKTKHITVLYDPSWEEIISFSTR